MMYPPAQEYQLEQLLREILNFSHGKTILMTPAEDYTAAFATALEKAGVAYKIIEPGKTNGSHENLEYPVDLRKITERTIYPYTLEKLMEGVRDWRKERRVRIIPSEQSTMLIPLLEKENIPYYIADPTTEPDFKKEYEINLLDICISEQNFK